MRKSMKLVLIGFLLVATPATVLPREAEKPQKAQTTAAEKQKVKQRTKRLLSAFLFVSMLPQKGKAVSRATISLSDTDQTFSGRIQMKYVEGIYRKYGFNNNVRLSLKKFFGRKYDFQKRLELSGRYVKQVAGIFTDRGLPRELAWLPLVESGFNPHAYSHKRAAGIWQFMPRTAKKMGLKIDWWVDERRDPIKSTEAAAEYLQYLYEKFGSWPLALAAYNGGEGRVNRALNKAGKDDFWALSAARHIRRETREYVPSYIAAAAIATHPQGFGFHRIRYRKPPKYDEVLVSRPMDFDVIARLADISVADIKELNPELRRWCTPPNVSNYALKVPEGAGDRFLRNVAKIRGDELELARFYTVKKGDTVEKIARNIGSSIQDIIDRNGLGRKAVIMTGKRILVPIESHWNQLMNKLMH